MTSFALFSDSSTARTLDDSEYGFIGRNASLMVGSTTAVNMSGNGANLMVSGLIASNYYGVIGTRDLQIIIDSTGSIISTGVFRAAMLFGGYGTRAISNAGFISGESGIEQSSITTLTGGIVPTTEYTLINSGTILGTEDDGVRLILLNGISHIDNSGTISGGRNGLDVGAVSSSATDELSVINSGTISGGNIGVVLGTTVAELINTGTIIGGAVGVQTGSGSDLVINSGQIIGDVELGLGNDEFRGGLGRVEGTVIGGIGNDTLDGGDFGADLQGGVGNDVLIGGDGNDTLDAGDHDDSVSGGAGEDLIFGGDGFEILRGGDGADLVYGGTGKDTVHGNSGEDSLFGEDGKDLLYGGKGDDLVDGGAAADALFGGGGDDELFGFTGDDRLVGGAGNDTVVGGAGQDTMEGNDGLDVFVFLDAGDAGNTFGTADEIIGFTQGQDLIDLRALAGGTLEFVGTGGFLGGGDGSVRYFVAAGGYAAVLVDADGDGSNDMRIHVRGLGAVAEDDFML